VTDAHFTTPVRVVLLDIEGTTTPIDFVHNVLFPYARARAQTYLSRHQSSADVQRDIAGLIAEYTADVERRLQPPPLTEPIREARLESLAAYVHWLMDQDRKSTPLKSLQGKIWEAGYHAGDLLAPVFDDVQRAFGRWRTQQRDICIYSSGSRLAQQLLFAHSEAGDLSVHIRDYFDTRIGAKRDAESYQRIAATLNSAPSDIVFVSDVTAELDAAQAAGMQTVLCVRAGNPAQPASAHPVIHTFDDVLP
jgi:enolase-phosphatase E1